MKFHVVGGDHALACADAAGRWIPVHAAAGRLLCSTAPDGIHRCSIGSRPAPNLCRDIFCRQRQCFNRLDSTWTLLRKWTSAYELLC